MLKSAGRAMGYGHTVRSLGLRSHLSSGIGHRFFSNLPNHSIIKMPALSPTMEFGRIMSWEKKEGDKIQLDDTLAIVETDKATMAYEVQEAGYLAKILAPTKVKLAVNAPIAIFVNDTSDVAAFANYTGEDRPST